VLERVIAAGQGGQGLMFAGKLLAAAMMQKEPHVTFMPSYGAEVRGGTANCHVKISSSPIHSPIVEEADTLIIMNRPSFKRFAERLRADGRLVLNTSMVDGGLVPEGMATVAVPATEIASDIGDVRVANMVMLGAYNAAGGWMEPDLLRDSLKAMTKARAGLLELNLEAVRRGAACVESSGND
jgi:2-oxoglutarate ferredoxin oxidoreductase subunit gamma